MDNVINYLPVKEAAKYLTGRTGRKFKKIDIFQAASKGQIKLSADFLATAKVNVGTLEPMISLPGNRVQYEEYRHNPHFGVIGTFDLWVEAPGSNMHEIIDGDLQIGRPFPDGLHFTTDSPDRVVEILNDDGTKSKKLPKDARWLVRISSLEDYLEAYGGGNPSSVTKLQGQTHDQSSSSTNKLYNLLEWLEMGQAVDWLRSMTGVTIKGEDLAALCNAGRCSVYVDADGATSYNEELAMCFTLKGRGRVRSEFLYTSPPNETQLHICGRFRAEFDCWHVEPCDVYPGDLMPGLMFSMDGWYLPYFKSSDIKTLADKMNNEPALSPSEDGGPVTRGDSSDEKDLDSDAALGAATRAQRKNFANRPRDAGEAREREYQRWRGAGVDIQKERERPATKRQLSALVKERLNLPDSEETIRKRL